MREEAQRKIRWERQADNSNVWSPPPLTEAQRKEREEEIEKFNLPF